MGGGHDVVVSLRLWHEGVGIRAAPGGLSDERSQANRGEVSSRYSDCDPLLLPDDTSPLCLYKDSAPPGIAGIAF